MKKLFIATAILASIGAAATANASQVKVGAGYQYNDHDDSDSTNGFTAEGTYYFSPVRAKDSPWEEAAFLGRNSNVSVQGEFADNNGTKDNEVIGSAEWFVPDTDFYVGAKIGQSKTELDDLRNTENTSTGYGVELGYFPVPNLLVAAGIQGADTEEKDDYSKSTKDEVSPSIRAKYVAPFGSGDINLEGSMAFGDLDLITVGADYYFDKTFSIGAGYEKDDGLNTDAFSIRSKKFLNQQFSVDGAVEFDEDKNTFTVGGEYRF